MMGQYNLADPAIDVTKIYYGNRTNPNFGVQSALRDFPAACPHYGARPWFSYWWGVATFFLHDRRVTSQVGTACGV
jgi:hypothetical protein